MIRWQTGKEIHNKFSDLLKKIDNGKLNWAFVEEEGAKRFVSVDDLHALIDRLSEERNDEYEVCLKCGERKCVICLKDLKRELFLNEKGDGVK
jgi:hypothetical protein